MYVRTMALAFVLMLAGLVPALAQRGPAGVAGTWDLLGEARVGLREDNDTINLSNGEEFYRNKSYRALRFQAAGGEIRLKSVRIHFFNGYTEDVEIDRAVKQGQSIDVALRGERSFIKSIDIRHQAKFNLSIGGGGLRIGEATMKVFGENVWKGRPSEEWRREDWRSEGDWRYLASEKFDRREDSIEIRVGRDQGRFGQIRLQHRGVDIVVREVRIHFGNGDVTPFRVERRLRDGDRTDPLVFGGQRRVERVTVLMQPRAGSGTVELGLFANERGGDPRGAETNAGPYRPRQGLELLGSADVGFRAERDVIRVGQSGQWWRDRGFEKLHFVSETHQVYMRSIRVVFQNGYAEDYQVNQELPPGREVAIQLRGRRSYVREIELVYRKEEDGRGKAKVSVYGER